MQSNKSLECKYYSLNQLHIPAFYNLDKYCEMIKWEIGILQCIDTHLRDQIVVIQNLPRLHNSNNGGFNFMLSVILYLKSGLWWREKRWNSHINVLETVMQSVSPFNFGTFWHWLQLEKILHDATESKCSNAELYRNLFLNLVQL